MPGRRPTPARATTDPGRPTGPTDRLGRRAGGRNDWAARYGAVAPPVGLELPPPADSLVPPADSLDAPPAELLQRMRRLPRCPGWRSRRFRRWGFRLRLPRMSLRWRCSSSWSTSSRSSRGRLHGGRFGARVRRRRQVRRALGHRVRHAAAAAGAEAQAHTSAVHAASAIRERESISRCSSVMPTVPSADRR